MNFAFSAEDRETDEANNFEETYAESDSPPSLHYIKTIKHIHTDLKASVGAVTIEGSEALEVTAKGFNDTYGCVKFFTKIGRCLFKLVT